jgi:hypothetical protein
MANVTAGYVWTSGETVTPTKLNSAAAPIVVVADNEVTTAKILDSAVTNAKLASGIADTKLATISTAGKVSNSATTATNANTANAIVARDASGNFSAGTITASFSGNVTGNVTGSLTGTASAIADGSVSTAKIVDGAVTQSKLASGVAASGPAFRAHANALQSVPSGTPTKVTFGTESYDTNGNFASSRFTPTVAGYYQINANVHFTAGTKEINCEIHKNGAAHSTGDQTTAESFAAGVSDLIYMNGTTDYVELFVYQNQGTSRSMTDSSARTYMSGFLARSA